MECFCRVSSERTLNSAVNETPLGVDTALEDAAAGYTP